MGFVKLEQKQFSRTFRTFLDAQQVFENPNESDENRVEALDYILNHKEISYVLEMLLKFYNNNENFDYVLIDYAFANFSTKPKRDDDFHMILKMLESQNAYLRNKAITFLQDSGETAKSFIKDILENGTRDVKIFAVNILGDVKYEESRDMLLSLIKEEKDINVLMTAVDYLGEIGEKEDIPLLEELKGKFPDEPYVEFGINMACEKIRA